MKELHGLTRIATNNIICRKQGAETVAAAFTDHFAVTVRMAMDAPRMTCKARTWRMNITLLDDTAFRDALKEQWGRWRRQIHNYPNTFVWRDTYVIRKLKQLLQHERAIRNRDTIDLENHYYDVIYRVARNPTQENRASHLKKLKDEIIRLDSIRQSGVFLDTAERDRFTGEDPTLHHYLKTRKRGTMRTITSTLDENGLLTYEQPGIMHTFVSHMKRRYAYIPIDVRRLAELVRRGMTKLPDAGNDALENPITMDELLQGVRKGKARKSPGHDGISNEFYRMMWDTINREMLDAINLMYLDRSVTEAQKWGTIVCLPKRTDPGGLQAAHPTKRGL